MAGKHGRLIDNVLTLQGHLSANADLIGMPVDSINRALEEILSTPLKFDAELLRISDRDPNCYTYYQVLRRLVSEEDGQEEYVQSRIKTAFAKDSDVALASTRSGVAPDIIYVVREDGGFSIAPAEHFKISDLQDLQIEWIPPTPKVSKMAEWINGQKSWIVGALNQCYTAIGEHQAGFLLSLSPERLLPLHHSMLGSELGLPYSNPTLFRLLRRRKVGIKAPSGSAVLPVRYLTPSKDLAVLYSAVPMLNAILVREFAGKNAITDEAMQREIGFVCERTIINYRKYAGIPNARERQKAYDHGASKPFSFRLSIDAYLNKSSP
ncbi:hypothetical protein HYY70_04780 [Candidatus Woesearchaeota archaeon]|nr:hypothetical protein [Candidatus Woesearchaeota archaeon]